MFANALSKAKNLDTAYTYTYAVLDSNYHCLGLENYAFHPEVEGFRLPTEAEWIFAAEQNWNPDSNWNVNNSGFQLQRLSCQGWEQTHAVLVNMLNGEITDLVYGDELWHPALWVQREQDGFSRLDGFEGIMNP